MPFKVWKNGTICYFRMTRREIDDYYLENPDRGASAIPTAASLKQVRNITVRPDVEPSEMATTKKTIKKTTKPAAAKTVANKAIAKKVAAKKRVGSRAKAATRRSPVAPRSPRPASEQ